MVKNPFSGNKKDNVKAIQSAKAMPVRRATMPVAAFPFNPYNYRQPTVCLPCSLLYRPEIPHAASQHLPFFLSSTLLPATLSIAHALPFFFRLHPATCTCNLCRAAFHPRAAAFKDNRQGKTCPPPCRVHATPKVAMLRRM